MFPYRGPAFILDGSTRFPCIIRALSLILSRIGTEAQQVVGLRQGFIRFSSCYYTLLIWISQFDIAFCFCLYKVSVLKFFY